jgi:flagellar hook capping protein FlgD
MKIRSTFAQTLTVIILALVAVPMTAAAQRPRPLSITAATTGLQTNDIGYMAESGNILRVTAGRTIAHMLNDGKTQSDWESTDIGTASSFEVVTSLATRGDMIALATSHLETISGATYSIGDGIYISPDGGTTWTRHGITDIFKERAGMSVPGGDTQCFGIEFHGDEIWAAFTTEFVVKTPDFGITWERFRSDSTNNPQPNPFEDDSTNQHRYLHLNYRAFDVAMAGDTLWVSTNAGINRSTDGGASWTNYDAGGSGLTGDFVPDVSVDTVKHVIWAATQASSIDEAELQSSGQDLFKDGVFNYLDWDLDHDGRIDGRGKSGISWSTDGGDTWQSYVPADDPAVNVTFTAWSFAFHGDTVWAAGSIASLDGMLVSTDAGATWKLQPVKDRSGLAMDTGQGIVDISYHTGALWIATSGGLGRSTDGGATWDFVLRFLQSTPLAGGPPIETGVSSTTLKTYAFPSPCQPILGQFPRIVFALRVAADVTITIYDTGGGLVRTMRLNGCSAGNHTVPWDGKNGNGRYVHNGVYIYRVSTSDGHSASGKIMVVN